MQRPIATLIAAAAIAASASSFALARSGGPNHVAPRAQRVEPRLDVDEDQVVAALTARRQLHLARLQAYADAGVFPKNKVSPNPLNVFIDDEGHVCAAANLIRLDGHGALVSQTARTDNYIVLSTVRSGPLMDWMLTSGFTQDEIARIQEPYMPVSLDEPPLVEPMVVSTEAQERERLQGVLRGVHMSLVANGRKSVRLAARRLMRQRPQLAAQLTASAQAPRTLGFAEPPPPVSTRP